MHKLLADYDKNITVPSATINGVMGVVDEEYDSSTDSDDERDNEHYEQEFVSQEMKKYARITTAITNVKDDDDPGDMNAVEGVDGMDYRKNALDIYANYNFVTTFIKKELPIDSFKQKILQLVEVNNVVIIQGPTGCGKTTQVPQYILDYHREKQEYCNIAVTQPRKIATINVARRVCEERGWTLGTVCGYQVGLEKKISPNILLTYMTTGVLLQKIISGKSLHQFTHIIIDEVHERNQELDFLLLIVRRFLFTNSSRTKVILMSATIEAEEFAHYFRSQHLGTSHPAPIIYVNKPSFYTKTIFYLEQLTQAIESTQAVIPNFNIDKPEISEGLWRVFAYLISVIDKLDVVDPVTEREIIGSVLVFLPGINEIEEANKYLELHHQERNDNKQGDDKSDNKVSPIKWEIIPLHSSLPNDEQAKVFMPPAAGYRKVILSTNIAESSITVPDSYYVIDFCQTKVMTVDPITKYMSLKLEWASHVNCEQRAGRVGRVGNGRVYRLVRRNFYNDKMAKRSLPEILRAPLERVVLQAKMLNLNDTPQQILALALNPPNLKNIEATVLTLKEIGALLQSSRGISSSSDGDMTFLGTIMANLPIDVRLSKLIVLGYLFSCVEDAIIIAAGCSIQNIFSIPFQQRFNAYRKLLVWADGSSSDLIALLNLFRVWQACKRENQFDDWREEHKWCIMNLVSLKGLREWNLLVKEITQRLEYLNIKDTVGPGKVVLTYVDKPLILKVITAGAFYPNFFIRSPNSVQLDEREAVKLVGGRDPFRTVFFTGMDPTQPGPLYIRAIKDMMNNESDITVGFDGSSKIYIEFKSFDRKVEQIAVNVDGFQRITSMIPGKIPMSVYEAIRKRQLQYSFSLKLLPSIEAWKWANKNGIKRETILQSFSTSSAVEEKNCYSDINYTPIPSLDIEWLTFKITEYVDAAHFWANTLESETYLAKIEDTLNKQVLYPALVENKGLKLGGFYAAKYVEDNLFYRCKIIYFDKEITQVLFVDYGNMQQVATKDIYQLPDRPECQLPALGIECILHGIQPSLKHNPKGFWSERVNNFCQRQTAGVLLYGKVHSVVNDVVYLDLYKIQPNRRDTKTINQIMLDEGFAEPADASFLSKEDHKNRTIVLRAENPNIEATRLKCDRVVNYQDFEGPKIGNNYKTVYLKGPYNPLEMKLYGCIESSVCKSVDIEGNSVNTVLLDDTPENYHSSLLVASYVGQTAEGGRLKLRQTTLLPSIPGLPLVLALLFCPTMDVKLTKDGTRVASVLCGLGYDKLTNKPHYPIHDLVMTLDTELTEEEINKINQIRFYMNEGVRVLCSISKEMSSQDEMIKTQNTLKRELIELIHLPRTRVDRVNVKGANTWTRGNNINAVVLQPNIDYNSEEIWPLLWFVRLKNVGNYNPNISKNLDDLHEMARSKEPLLVDIKCELCSMDLFGVNEVRYHLISTDHKEAVMEYEYKLQEIPLDSDDE